MHDPVGHLRAMLTVIRRVVSVSATEFVAHDSTDLALNWVSIWAHNVIQLPLLFQDD
jgi:hypothetical protein